jgi:hypothetical protein
MTFELNILETIFFYGVLVLWTGSLIWSNKRLTDKIISLKMKNEHLCQILKKRKRRRNNKYVKLGKNVYVQEQYMKEAENAY